MDKNYFTAQSILDKTIQNIEANYMDDIQICMSEIENASNNCKFSTKIDLGSNAGVLKKYFMYKGYNAKLTGGTLELAWNINMNNNDMNVMLKEKAILRALM